KGNDIKTAIPSLRVKKGLGLTFQTNRVFHHLSVQQNLEIPQAAMRANGVVAREERYRLALDRFGLDPMDDTPANAIPHHKRQWLEILMVLPAGPDLALLDEPTAGMPADETRKAARAP